MTDRRDELLATLVIRIAAIRDVTAVLLSLQARASPDPSELFREVSEGLDKRLDSLKVTEPNLLQHVERIRKEVDWIVAAAQRATGK